MGVHLFPILNPPPTSLPIPSLWVIPVHQPQASCILHWTWTGNSYLYDIIPVHSEGDQPWDFFGRNDATAETPVLWPPHAKSLTHWKSLWSWEGLGAGGEGNDRGWDGWMASLTQWMWVWVNSRSWWWAWRPGVLRFMGSQRVGHDWVTELNWIWLKCENSIIDWTECHSPKSSPAPSPNNPVCKIANETQMYRTVFWKDCS